MGMQCLAPSFGIFDVYKNPQIAKDLERFAGALAAVIKKLDA